MKNLIIYTSTFLCVIVLNSCSNGSGSLLNAKNIELCLVQIPNKEFKISIVYLPSNATIQPAIQVRKQFIDKEEIAETYERYNCMDTCKLINDTTLMLVIRDTISILGNRPDTIIIYLK